MGRRGSQTVEPLNEAVPLASIRYHAKLANLPLIRQSQLSVMPLTKESLRRSWRWGRERKPGRSE